MIKRGLSVFNPPKDLIDASGLSTKLSQDEQVVWVGTPGWASSLYCAMSWRTPLLLLCAPLAYRDMYLRNGERYGVDGLLEGQSLVVWIIIVMAVGIPLAALYCANGFIYFITTRRFIVKVDRTKALFRLFRYFREVADSEGFAAYDIKLINGCRVYCGLWGYGNVSVAYSVNWSGSLRDDFRNLGQGKSIRKEPFFLRDHRYVKTFFRIFVGFHLAESFCNTYFGIRSVAEVGRALNDQCSIGLGTVSGKMGEHSSA
jgi:hypothetical protein